MSQTQKDKYCVTLLTRSTYSSQMHRNRIHNGGCQKLGVESVGSSFTGTVSLKEDEKVLETDGGGGCTGV